MTWNELNECTEELWFNSYDEQDFIDNNGEEVIWSCQMLDQMIEGLKEFDAPTDGFGRVTDYHAEYLENEMLIKTLEEVR